MPTPPDLTFELVSTSDEATPQRDGSILRQRKYVFYLGKFGPFTERFPVGGDSTVAVQQRIDALKSHLTTLHR